MSKVKPEDLDFGEPEKITPAEVVGISLFMIILLIFRNAPLGLFVTILGTYLYVSVERYAKKKKQAYKQLQKTGIKMMLIYALFCVLDTASTYLGVIYLKFGEERNQFLVFLWENFGILKGFLLHSILIICLFIYFFIIFNYFKADTEVSKINILLAFSLLFAILLLYIFVLINNYGLLLYYLFS